MKKTPSLAILLETASTHCLSKELLTAIVTWRMAIMRKSISHTKWMTNWWNTISLPLIQPWVKWSCSDMHRSLHDWLTRAIWMGTELARLGICPYSDCHNGEYIIFSLLRMENGNIWLTLTQKWKMKMAESFCLRRDICYGEADMRLQLLRVRRDWLG